MNLTIAFLAGAAIYLLGYAAGFAQCHARWKRRTRKCVGCHRFPEGVNVELDLYEMDCETAQQILRESRCDHDFVITEHGETCCKCGYAEHEA